MVSKSEVEPSAVSYIQNLNHFTEPELEGTRYQNNIRSLTKYFISPQAAQAQYMRSR